MTTTATSSWTLALTGVSYTFEVIDVDVTLDELNSIYCRAKVTVAPYPAAHDATIRAAILAGTLRSTLTGNRATVTPAVASATRAFALAVVERVVHPDKSVTFDLASDEALLELRGSVSASITDVGGGVTSLQTARNVCNSIINTYAGATPLRAGTVDADLRRLKPERNLITNGGFEIGIAGWTASPTAGTLTWSNARALVGARSLRFSAIGAGNAYLYQTAIPVKQNTWYKADAYISSQVSRLANLSFQLLDASGNLVRQLDGASVASPTSGWSSLGVLKIYVDDPAATQLRLLINTAGNVAGNQHYLDEIRFVEIDPATMGQRGGFGRYAGWASVVERPFYDVPNTAFHGDTTDTAYYQYDWEGTAGNSFSTRTPLVNRDFNLLLLQPGQNIRDFLDPIIGATGGRLFCDEARDWRLVDNTYTVAGTIALSDVTNVTETTDTVSLSESFDGVPTYFTGVVVEYETLDANTNTITRAYDVAGSATGRVYRKVVKGGYPGAGEAAAILARAALRQRAIPVTAVTDLATTPGKALTLTRDGVNFTGRVSAVTWRWSAGVDGDSTDTMLVTPRDLVEV